MSSLDKNIVAVLILCEKHKKVGLTTLLNSSTSGGATDVSGSWFPNAPMIETESWESNADICIGIALTDNKPKLDAIIGEAYTRPRLVLQQRLGRPGGPGYMECIIFSTKIAQNEIKLPKGGAPWKCCTDYKGITWHTMQDIKSGRLGLPLAGREVLDVLKDPEPYGIELFEFDVRKATEFTPKDYALPNHKPSANEELLKSANFKVAEVSHIYGEYLACCYPSFYMNPLTFGLLLDRLQIRNMSNEVLAATFTAIAGRDGFANFHQVLRGLAAMDDRTAHGGVPGSIRLHFIFRFYDQNCDGALNDEELRKMTTDIVVADPDVSSDKKQAEIATRFSQMKSYAKSSPINEELFKRAINDKKFRGTSALFKSGVSLSNSLSTVITKKTSNDKADSMYGIHKRGEGPCKTCRPKKYEFCPVVVTVNREGRQIKTELLSNMRNIGSYKENPNSKAVQHDLNVLFNPKHIANEVLQSLREFDASTHNKAQFPMPPNFKPTKYKSSDDYGWMKEDPRKALSKIQQLCQLVMPLFANEKRIQKLQSPCYVLGDIHGNLKDLMTYDRILWSQAPAVVPQNYLFLGDYVDRGQFSVECSLYLFAMKLLNPDRFFMCRGNHEIESLQHNYTFHSECDKKYGSYGSQIAKVINGVFEVMPLGAIIDESIFCAHGGIPRTDLSIEVLQTKIPKVMVDPQAECDSAWEIMWNDPASDDEIIQAQNLNIPSINGYYDNSKRSTAFIFTEQALQNFLSINGLQRVIRGHECRHQGFSYHMNGKLITVFSSSNYAGPNKAACVLVDAGKIRVIRLTTN